MNGSVPARIGTDAKESRAITEIQIAKRAEEPTSAVKGITQESTDARAAEATVETVVAFATFSAAVVTDNKAKGVRAFSRTPFYCKKKITR